MPFSQPTQSRLQNQHTIIHQFLQGRPVDWLHEQHILGKWSVHEHVAHLGRYQEVFEERIKRVLAEDVPQFSRYDAENDPRHNEWVNLPYAILVDRLEIKRKQLSQHMLSLLPSSLGRTGSHARLGAMDIPDWTEFFLLHEAHHVYSIFRLVREFGK